MAYKMRCLHDNLPMSEMLPNITSDEIDLDKDESAREDEIKRQRPPHHDK